MNEIKITVAQYVSNPLSGTTACIQATIDNQEMSVPLDPANRHYAEIMRQVNAGDLVIAAAEE